MTCAYVENQLRQPYGAAFALFSGLGGFSATLEAVVTYLWNCVDEKNEVRSS